MPAYLVPDVYVFKTDSKWQVGLNPEASPKIRINREYGTLIRRTDHNPDNNCLRPHLTEARWFL